MKIMSIDFDYYTEAEAEVLMATYPDGIDLPTPLSTVVWGSKYADRNMEKQLKSVKANESEIEATLEILGGQREEIPVMVCASHIKIYSFIESLMGGKEDEKLCISHIDMHHDMFNDNEDLDCGNWLAKIANKYGERLNVEWVANPISSEVYAFNAELSKVVLSSVTEMKYKTYDAIFLCRSDCWLPPHLDGKFNIMKEFIKEHFREAKIEQAVEKPRDYLAAIKQIRKSIKKGKSMELE